MGGVNNKANEELTTILLVDDDEFMLEVVAKLLRHDRRYEVIGEARDAADAISHCKEHRPDIILLDINLPGISGIDAVPDLKRLCSHTRILLCTAFATDDRIIAALRSGAHGFIEKTGHWSDLLAAIDHVAAGEQYFCAKSSAALVHFSQSPAKSTAADLVGSLSAREKEVLRLVSRGESSKTIAAALGISIGTVDVHRANLMKKLGVKNVAGLVAFAFQANLLP
jgi:DNA-binding NarL/FixJ family response regulator